MKSCPKCNRTFPDEGQKFCTFDGGLLIAQQAFDPNATIRATMTDVNNVPEKSTSRDLPDPNATIVESSFASTVALPRNTAPTGPPSTGDFGGQQQGSSTPPPVFPSQDQTVALPSLPPTPPPPAPAPPPPPVVAPPVVPAAANTGAVAAAAPAKKKSKLPLIIVGVLLLFLLGGGALAAAFFFVIKPKLDEAKNRPQDGPVVSASPMPSPETKPSEQPSTTPTPEVDNYTPPLGTTAFVNSDERLDGKLKDHFFDFSFYYPSSWQKDEKSGVAGASSFVKVERRMPPDFTQENFTVGWYTSAGTYDLDLPNYPRRVEEFSAALSKNIPEYRKVSEGPTTVNKLKAYEFRYVGFSKGTERGDLKIFGRVIFLPTGKDGDTTGATLTMLSTSLAPELTSIDDLGAKGEAPVILDSFRFGKKK
ncbi:MAG TPA: hypothetical protein VI306_02460 [Pyrinomonadaceae bacterium]